MLNNRFSNISLSLLVTLLCLMSTQILYADQNSNQEGYQIHKLVSDMSGVADQTDPDLVNAWGIAFNPDGFVWVNDGGTGKSTLYDGEGIKQGLVVTIPGPSNSDPSKPTGIVFFGGNNGGKDNFKINDNPSRFIFATEDGTISGWAPASQQPPPTTAIEMFKNVGAIYKGLTLSADGDRYLLYATDFHNAKVDVFGDDFKLLDPPLAPEAFKDPKIPSGFAPFGIQAINGVIFVTYAKQDDNQEDDVPGPGRGYVNAFDTSGHLLQRIAVRGKLNAPWGLTLAPANFGKFSNHLLVGNFGDGTIIAYDLNKHLQDHGTKLRQTNGHPIIYRRLMGHRLW